MSGNEYVNIHLPSNRAQGIQVSRWNTLVTMNNAYSYGRVGHRQGERGGDRLVKRSLMRTVLETGASTHLIVISTDDVHVSRNGPQIVVRFTVANIASAENLLDFSWNEKLLEL